MSCSDSSDKQLQNTVKGVNQKPSPSLERKVVQHPTRIDQYHVCKDGPVERRLRLLENTKSQT